MEPKHNLPFKVGQQAESKSFLTGFRGAWFRCKITSISSRKGHIGHTLEFFDFPDEKVSWTKLYQKPPDRVSREEMKMHLMVRPSFPPIYRESRMPDIFTISEVIAVVNDAWKVGDLVDWWTDGCYWSGKITHLLGEDKVQIELPKPPVGEGKSYEAFCKDLRPSLDWSPEHGWSVPISKESDDACYSTRLIQPANEEDNQAGGRASCKFCSASLSSHGSAGSFLAPEVSSNPPAEEILKQPLDGKLNRETTQSLDQDLDLGGVTWKPSFSDSVSSSHDKDVPAATDRNTARRDRYNHGVLSKKMKINGTECLNSSFSDTIESSILDLEELVNRIKWLKRVHQFGYQLSNATMPSWKFLESRASFKDR